MFDYLNTEIEGSTWTASCNIADDLPCLQGHFPTKSILPAIAQLEMVTGFISAVTQSVCNIEGASLLKFLYPILPKDVVKLVLDVENHQVKFTIYVDEKLCSKGRLNFRSQD